MGVNESQKQAEKKNAHNDILCGGDTVQYQAPFLKLCVVLTGRPILKFASKARILGSEQSLHHVVSSIHLVHVGELRTRAILVEDGGVDGLRVFEHELVNNSLLSRAGVLDFVELLKKWKPRNVAALVVECRRAVRKPLR
jgi:hypothetical protein